MIASHAINSHTNIGQQFHFAQFISLLRIQLKLFWSSLWSAFFLWLQSNIRSHQWIALASKIYFGEIRDSAFEYLENNFHMGNLRVKFDLITFIIHAIGLSVVGTRFSESFGIKCAQFSVSLSPYHIYLFLFIFLLCLAPSQFAYVDCLLPLFASVMNTFCVFSRFFFASASRWSMFLIFKRYALACSLNNLSFEKPHVFTIG